MGRWGKVRSTILVITLYPVPGEGYFKTCVALLFSSYFKSLSVLGMCLWSQGADQPNSLLELQSLCTCACLTFWYCRFGWIPPPPLSLPRTRCHSALVSISFLLTRSPCLQNEGNQILLGKIYMGKKSPERICCRSSKPQTSP